MLIYWFFFICLWLRPYNVYVHLRCVRWAQTTWVDLIHLYSVTVVSVAYQSRSSAFSLHYSAFNVTDVSSTLTLRWEIFHRERTADLDKNKLWFFKNAARALFYFSISRISFIFCKIQSVHSSALLTSKCFQISKMYFFITSESRNCVWYTCIVDTCWTQLLVLKVLKFII